MRLQHLTQRLTQMRAGAQQARVVMHDQVNRDIPDIGFKTTFVLKTAAEAGGFKELQKRGTMPPAI